MINNAISNEVRLESLYQLQKIESQIDKINFIKGELPLEVEEMNDYLVGLNNRLNTFQAEMDSLDKDISDRNRIKEETKNNIINLDKQQISVKNNREFESLSKELELSKLEIELCEKKIKDFTEKKKVVNDKILETTNLINEKEKDLIVKRQELTQIEEETNKELNELMILSDKSKINVDERLLKAYTRIRNNYRNGLAVVTIDRNSCGGCFAKIPLQRQLEVKLRKKIIVCENCGRILTYPLELQKLEEEKVEVEEVKPTRSRSKRVRE